MAALRREADERAEAQRASSSFTQWVIAGALVLALALGYAYVQQHPPGAARAVPTPAYSGPAYVAPAGGGSGTSDQSRQEDRACEAQWRAYDAQKRAYDADLARGGFGILPQRPFC
jgi:hypothetical protein